MLIIDSSSRIRTRSLHGEFLWRCDKLVYGFSPCYLRLYVRGCEDVYHVAYRFESGLQEFYELGLTDSSPS